MNSQTRPARRRAAMGGVVGFLVVMELGSGILQGWYPMLLAGMGVEFGVTAAELNWVSASYLLATVVCVPIIAKLGDRYGHKKMLVIAATLVAIGSIVVALAPNFVVLLIGRALQGPLAAFLPLEFAIVRDRDPNSSGRSIGKLVAALTLGAAFGVFVSGVLFTLIGDLRAVLWIPTIFMILCVPIVALLVPESQTRAQGSIDWIGATLLGIGLFSALLGVSNAATWGLANPVTWFTILGGAALIVAWVAFEKRVTHPLIDIRVLSTGGIGLPIAIAALFGAQLFGSQTAGSVFMLTDPAVAGFGLGLSPATAGAVALVSALTTFVVASFGFRIATRIGDRRVLVLGGLLAVISYGTLLLAANILVVNISANILLAVANGMLISVLPAIVVRRAPADSVGIASALYNTSRTAAGAVASAVFALIMASFAVTVGAGSGAVTMTAFGGYLAVWAVCGLMGLAVMLLAFRVDDSLSTGTAEASPAADADDPTTAPTDSPEIPAGGTR